MVFIREVNGKTELGMVVRRTGSQKGKFTILGGRIKHGESIAEAISRHLLTDLRVARYSFFKCAPDQPVFVQQYFHADGVVSDTDCFDPSKHAVTLVYLVQLNEEPVPQNEASSIAWFSETPPAQQCGYNQQVVLARLFELLEMINKAQ